MRLEIYIFALSLALPSLGFSMEASLDKNHLKNFSGNGR